MSSYDVSDDSRLRLHRLIVRIAVAVLWASGVLIAIESGFDPGPWWSHGPPRPWPYPLAQVALEIGKITLVSVGLYDFLRPQPDAPSFERAAKALGVMLVTLLWEQSATDQPGYVYATGNYVLLATGVLLCAVILYGVLIAVRAVRSSSGSGKHAA